MTAPIAAAGLARERMLAAIRGDEVDRFPVWLKMTNRTWQTPQPEPWHSMSDVDLLQACGCDLMLANPLRPQGHAPHIERSVTQTDTTRTTVVKTPDGQLRAESHLDPFTRSWHPTRCMVSAEEDLAKARWMYRDTVYTVDPDKAAASTARQKDLEAAGAVTMMGVGPGPWMELVENLAGPEQTMYLEADAPDALGELMQLMHEDRMRMLKAMLPHLAADMLWLTENTSTSLISPRQFRNHCMPHLRDYGNMVLEHQRIPVHHMCGTLNELLEMIDALPATVNEAFTTRPLGNVSLAEGRRRMPSKCLMGGTNATLWLEPVDAIIQTVADDLANCPDRRRIFLTSAGVLPAPVSFEKARAVVAGLKQL